MKTKSFSRSFVGGVFIIGQCIANAGCETEEADVNLPSFQETTRQNVTSITLTQKEVDTLAQRYLTEKMNALERKVVLERVQSLSPDQSLAFFQSLKNIQLEGGYL